MKNLKVIAFKDGNYFVSQCLNVDISSFSTTFEKEVGSLKEGLELYFEDNTSDKKFLAIDQVIVGETVLNA